MASVNKATILGHLGRDPEIRSTQDGTKIVSLSVATSEKRKDKEFTEWHRVVSFNERINEFVEKYLHKGSRVYLEGQLQTRKWTDKDGAEKYTTEIVIGKFKGELVSLDSGKREAGSREDNDEEIPY